MSTLREEFQFRIRTALAYGRALGKGGSESGSTAKGWVESETSAAIASLNAAVARLAAADVARPACPLCGSRDRIIRGYIGHAPCQGAWHGPTSDEVREGVRAFFDGNHQPRQAWTPSAEVAFRAGVAWMVDYAVRGIGDAS